MRGESFAADRSTGFSPAGHGDAFGAAASAGAATSGTVFVERGAPASCLLPQATSATSNVTCLYTRQRSPLCLRRSTPAS